MSNPTTLKDADGYASFGPHCHACGRPDMSNMTWQDGLKHLLTIFLSTPRMWPVGFILDSPYSPFCLEKEVPALNWRDAFEDLLALEAGRPMIPEDKRRAEDSAAACRRFDRASSLISTCNFSLQVSERMEAECQEAYREAVKRQDQQKAALISEQLLPRLEWDRLIAVEHAQRANAEYEKEKDATSSSLKHRGQWISSLMNSGALPNWQWMMQNSHYGPIMTFHRTDAPPGLESPGIRISEFEIWNHFEEGIPYSIPPPTWFHPEELRAAIESTKSDVMLLKEQLPNQLITKWRPSNASIVAQSARSEPIELADGSTGSKTVLTSWHADDTNVTKEFIDQPAELFEEIENAQDSMQAMRVTVNNFSKRQDWIRFIEILKELNPQPQYLEAD